MMRVPGRARGAIRCERTVSLQDIYPTLVDLCGLPNRDGLDGQSLRPLLTDPEHAWDRPVLMTYGFQNHALQTERWRYIQYHDGGQELYDHRADPNEWANLADRPEHGELIRKLQAKLPQVNREPR